jgi:pimeloyl-ACP methyl ester carboxylesterase/uncharacterized membrane protein HdeD (DUF308 family)
VASNILYVRSDTGNGDPLILLHGMFGDGTQWEKITKILKDDYRVIVVDLLGHGKSPRPKKADYTDKEHVEALNNTIEKLGIKSRLTVVGYSMGGAVALAFASTYPQKVSELYLISTPFYLTSDEMIPVDYEASIIFTKLTTSLFKFIEGIMIAGGKIEKLLSYGSSSEKFHKMIGAHDNQLDATIIRKNLDNLIREFDFVGHLKRIKSPITFFVGKKDIFVIQGQLNALRQFQPNMDIQRLEIMKVDHMLVQNLPHEIADLLKKNRTKLLHIENDTGIDKESTLVLLHGIESSSSYWDTLVPYLEKNKRVVTIDLLGFGKSPKPLNIAYSLENQVDYLKATLDNAGVEEIELAGHSLGSLVALSFAAKYPQRIKKLTLLAPVFVLDKSTSENPVIKRLHFIDRVSDGSFLYSHTAQALGYNKISKYIPSIRSVKNAVNQQKAIMRAMKASKVPTTIIYGKRDGLIDKNYLHEVSSQFTNVKLIELKDEGHNFILFNPEQALKAISPELKFTDKPKKSNKVPKTFFKQFVGLTAPILLAKSFIYTVTGILLLSTLAPWIITVGLVYFLVKLGYGYIRGSFSLKNENLSYLGYLILGIIVIASGYLLVKNTDLAIKISIILISSIIIFSGLTKIIVAAAWTKKKSIRRTLMLSGVLMTLVGLFALSGGVISIRILEVGLAVVLIARGFEFGAFAFASIALAYVRGFSRD